MLIDLFCSDLIAGYTEINLAREALVKKWRQELLRAYTAQWDRYTQQLAEQEARRVRYQRFLPFIGVVLLVICSTGAWFTLRSVDLACLGMVLTLGTGFGALIALGVWMSFSQIPPPPENPVTRTSNDEDESPLRQKLFPELLPLWQVQLGIPIPPVAEVERLAAETGDWSLSGEFDLIRELERVASPDTYILHRLQPAPDDYMDVVVIGPRGIWYFEVEHWNAQFVWQAGTWQVWQSDPLGRSPQPVALSVDPDQRWARMRDETLAYLKASAPELLKRLPVLGNIQGGIVFSNPNADIQIDRLAPFRYATIEQWVKTYQAAPRLRDMSPERTLQLLEVMLKQHQSFYPNAELHSMQKAVARVTAQVEQGIQAWIDSA